MDADVDPGGAHAVEAETEPPGQAEGAARSQAAQQPAQGACTERCQRPQRKGREGERQGGAGEQRGGAVPARGGILDAHGSAAFRGGDALDAKFGQLALVAGQHGEDQIVEVDALAHFRQPAGVQTHQAAQGIDLAIGEPGAEMAIEVGDRSQAATR